MAKEVAYVRWSDGMGGYFRSGEMTPAEARRAANTIRKQLRQPWPAPEIVLRVEEVLVWEEEDEPIQA